MASKVPNSSDATQVKMSRLTNTTNMIMKSEIFVKTTSLFLTLEDGDTMYIVSLTLIDSTFVSEVEIG